MLSYFGGSLLFRISVLMIVSLPLFLVSEVARADVVMWYVTISCDPSRGHVLIEGSAVSEGNVPPERSIPLSDFPGVMSNLPPALVCGMGQYQDVSAKSVIDEDQPGDDGMELYINYRPMNQPIAFRDHFQIKVERDSIRYFFVVTTCEENKCLSKKITAPSFRCDKARSGVEQIVCGSDRLSELDIELSRSYNILINKKLNSIDLVVRQKEWLDDRAQRCKIKDAPFEWSFGRKSSMEDIDCLTKLYETRIRYVGSISSRSR
jgi:uncharacterized protein